MSDDFKLPDTSDYTFTQWLESTEELQIRFFGQVPNQLQGDERKAWFAMNVLAATDELHEFLNEVPWKPWATHDVVNREQAVGELVDVLHFIGNLLATLSVTGEELTHRYRMKQMRNANRMTQGYTGKEKCPGCHRDTEEIRIMFLMGKNVCSGCGIQWSV